MGSSVRRCQISSKIHLLVLFWALSSNAFRRFSRRNKWQTQLVLAFKSLESHFVLPVTSTPLVITAFFKQIWKVWRLSSQKGALREKLHSWPFRRKTCVSRKWRKLGDVSVILSVTPTPLAAIAISKYIIKAWCFLHNKCCLWKATFPIVSVKIILFCVSCEN